MTREEAKQLLPIIQAYAEGRTVQIRNLGNGWTDVVCPKFEGVPDCYRIKPEPVECWALVDERGAVLVADGDRGYLQKHIVCGAVGLRILRMVEA